MRHMFWHFIDVIDSCFKVRRPGACASKFIFKWQLRCDWRCTTFVFGCWMLEEKKNDSMPQEHFNEKKCNGRFFVMLHTDDFDNIYFQEKYRKRKTEISYTVYGVPAILATVYIYLPSSRVKILEFFSQGNI